MKKLFAFTLLFVSIFVLAACGGDGELTELNVVFVPSRDAAEILEATEPLAELLKAELNALGYNFETINVTVSADYAAAAEAAKAGTADVVFLPGGTYVTYSDGLVPILAAARDSLTKDFTDPALWNDGLPTENISGSKDATTYRSIIIAGQSTLGRALADKVNAGTALTWDDIKDAAFCTGGATSSASYVYPNLWLSENFNMSIDDMPNAVNAGGYGASVAQIEAETCDIAALYGDARMHNPFATGDIFALTDVIAVTVPIANDGIQVGGHINVKLAEALQIAFMNLINDPANEAIFDIYSHSAYSPVTFVAYEGSRKVNGLDAILDD
ncbi:PhnD/SsuA/transferrin family substrate-binding protein [Candidatus Izimaplasma bacterium]|nr:PhnD/SsuA/transferrin family substrate-binding protein [Candidatus Izimaplasma bacterium]